MSARHDDLATLARDSLVASTGAQADTCDARIAQELVRLVAAGDGEALAQSIAAAPSPDILRHLWRVLARSERAGALGGDSPVRLFALPVIVVAALESAQDGVRELPGTLADPAGLAALLVEHGALAGNGTIALAASLVEAASIEIAQLPSLFAGTDLEHAGTGRAPLDLPPAPIIVTGNLESVHLRFLVGTALAAPGADLFRDGSVGKWGMPFAQTVSAWLGVAGASVLALPRAPLPLVEAVWQGRVAQREVAAQLFTSNALRELRSRTGEPAAVISVHRGGAADDDTPREVRLSLSSPFEPRDAQGLRSPLWPLDRPDDVVAMLATLLSDCRVTDVTVMPGVHQDIDPVTRGPLFFKPGAPLPAVRH